VLWCHLILLITTCLALYPSCTHDPLCKQLLAGMGWVLCQLPWTPLAVVVVLPPHKQLLVRLGVGGVLSGAVLGQGSRHHHGCQELISKSFVSNQGMGDKEKNSPIAQETSTSLGPFCVPHRTVLYPSPATSVLVLSSLSPSSCTTAVFVRPSPSPSLSSSCGGCPHCRVASLLSCCDFLVVSHRSSSLVPAVVVVVVVLGS
jgi:hypothetical protein